jgi:hypothetical protein
MHVAAVPVRSLDVNAAARNHADDVDQSNGGPRLAAFAHNTQDDFGVEPMENPAADAPDLPDTDPSAEGESSRSKEHAGGTSRAGAMARQIERHATPLLIGAGLGAIATLAVVSVRSKRGRAARTLFTRSEPTLLAIVLQAAVLAFGRTVSRHAVTAAVEKFVTRAMVGPARQSRPAQGTPAAI